MVDWEDVGDIFKTTIIIILFLSFIGVNAILFTNNTQLISSVDKTIDGIKYTCQEVKDTEWVWDFSISEEWWKYIIAYAIILLIFLLILSIIYGYIPIGCDL